MKPWSFKPAEFIPFRDTKAIEKVIRIKRKDFDKHQNPDYRITIMPDSEVGFRWVADMFHRIVSARDEGRKVVIITPNPARCYMQVAYLINRFKVDCKHVYTFNMDEYANEDGQTPPESWPLSFMYAFKKFFWSEIDPKLRPPEKQVRGPDSKTIKDYSRTIADMGGADICYSGPGWTGHVAFVDPDSPQFKSRDLKEFLKKGARISRLSPFTIAQNSLHGFFGASGNLCAVPPMAATIGPADVAGAKNRIDIHSLVTHGSFSSWQRRLSWAGGPHSQPVQPPRRAPPARPAPGRTRPRPSRLRS